MKLIKLTLLTFIFIYLFYGFDFNNIDFSKLPFWGIIITMFILFMGQIVLSIRFKTIINSKFIPAYETIVVSNFLNMILPARLGEVSKAVYLKKFYNYDYNKSISAIFIERFFDVIILFFIVILWAYLYFSNQIIHNSIIILSILIIGIILFFNSKLILNLIKKLPFKFAELIYKNIQLLFGKSHIILIWSFILWIVYLMSYWSFFLFLDLNINQIIELFIFSTIALAIPLAPAGIGTFEGVIVFYLSNYGINKEDALLFASVYHFLIFLVDFLLFYSFLWNKNLTLSQLKGN